MWTTETAREFTALIEPIALNCKYSIAIGGSVWHKGHSTKDLDLVMVPFYLHNRNTLTHLLKSITGMKLKRTAMQMRAGWSEPDTKDVEHWEWRERRIDIIWLNP
jgi:hypothetical protein